MTNRCATCKFYRAPAAGQPHGECWANPPVPVMVAGRTGVATVFTAPTVQAHYSCRLWTAGIVAAAADDLATLPRLKGLAC